MPRRPAYSPPLSHSLRWRWIIASASSTSRLLFLMRLKA
jgi:hypothetical protein